MLFQKLFNVTSSYLLCSVARVLNFYTLREKDGVSGNSDNSLKSVLVSYLNWC